MVDDSLFEFARLNVKHSTFINNYTRIVLRLSYGTILLSQSWERVNNYARLRVESPASWIRLEYQPTKP